MTAVGGTRRGLGIRASTWRTHPCVPFTRHPCRESDDRNTKQGCFLTGAQRCVRYVLPREFVTVTREELGATLEQMGCPKDKCLAMAAQLDKRAQQLAGKTGRGYDEALAHLLGLMKQGWAAKEKGL